MAAKDVLGRRGEDLAVRHLEAQGLVVLSRNWRCRAGELDVVATDAAQLVVCEVKTRSSTRFGSPAEAVGEAKAARIRRLAQAWQTAHRVRWCPIRYDLVTIVAEPGRPVVLEHVTGAF